MAGVFISDGMRLRIPAGGLTLSIGDDGAIESVARFEVMLDVWPFWLDVAIDQAVNAVGARKELEKSAATTGTESLEADQGDLLAQECKAGMVSIAAAAFALDSFYAGVKPFAPAGEGLQKGFRKADTPRHGRISETLRRSFHVPDKQARQLHQSVEEIFKYRDWAVHPPAEFREPAKHDLFNVGVEWRFVAFRASNAAATTRMAASLIDECLNAPRRNNPGLVAWCDGHKDRSRARRDRVESELGE